MSIDLIDLQLVRKNKIALILKMFLEIHTLIAGIDLGGARRSLGCPWVYEKKGIYLAYF